MQKFKKLLSILYKISPFVFFAFGVCCIIFHESITTVFPYIFGSIVLAIGVIGFAFGLMNLIIEKHKPTALAYGTTLTVLGIICLVKAQSLEIIPIICIAWALVSIFKSTMQLAYGIEQVRQKMKRSIFNFFQAAFSIVLGILLMLDVSIISIDHHIILLGVELLISSVSIVGGLEEEVSLWQLIDIHKKKEETSEKTQENTDEEKKAS